MRKLGFVLPALLLLEIPFLGPACSTSENAGGVGGASSSVSASGASTSASSGGGDAGSDALAPPPIDRTQGEAALAPRRASCAFQAGAWPAQTIGTEYPVGDDIPIKHVLVILQENRSFDHYLGRLVAQGYYEAGDFSAGLDGGAPGSGFSHSNQLDAPPAGWSNLDADGGAVTPHPDDEHCFGVNHDWAAEHDNYDDGKLDHFVTQNGSDGQKTFFYEDDTVIPFYYALASTFSVGDRYFASVLSDTAPNRIFAMAATSFGLGNTGVLWNDTADSPLPQIFSLLERGGHTWKDYADAPSIAHQTTYFSTFGFRSSTLSHLKNVTCDLMSDLAHDTLPDVAFMMGDEPSALNPGGGTSDEGPSALPGIGGQVVENVLRALFASPAWKDTVVFIAYDENGGMADHVSPAPACSPDAFTPYDPSSGAPLPGVAFDRTGFRVPFIVVSPYAKAHFVSHTVYDHTSLLRFIESRFGLPALTARDANAIPPMEMFDFANPPFMTPPTLTAHTTVPQTILDQCGQAMKADCTTSN